MDDDPRLERVALGLFDGRKWKWLTVAFGKALRSLSTEPPRRLVLARNFPSFPLTHPLREVSEAENDPRKWLTIPQGTRPRQRICEDVTLEDFEEVLPLHFDPLPCWSHLEESVWRSEVAELVGEIEAETLEMHRREGTVPLGATAVLRVHPHERPAKEKRSPKPAFHAARRQVREKMRAAFAAFVECYAEAAERLRNGAGRPRFPPNCFPPGLPFVPPWRSAEGTT